MDKRVKIRLLGKASLSFPEWSPVTIGRDRILFMILQNKFEKFENWVETDKISMSQFESQLIGETELEEAYVDVYSKTAVFYKCRIKHKLATFEYLIMVKDGKIVLLFYHIVSDDNQNLL